MGRAPCCEKNGLKKGPWTPEEDQKLLDYIQTHGYGNWRTLPKNAGLQRCGKSCRLRWTNYLRPDIKRGRFSFEEEETIIQLHSILGNKWSAIAARLPGRTDNEIKNYWNTHIRKRLLRMGIDPVTHSPRLDLLELSSILYNQCQINMSRTLNGEVQSFVNPELLRLATSLMTSSQRENQNQYQSFLQNQYQVPLMDESNTIQSQVQENITSCSTIPFSDEEVVLMNEDPFPFSAGNSLSSNLTQDCYVPQPTNYKYYGGSDDQTGLLDYTSISETSNFPSNINNQSFSFGASVLSTPSSSPTPLNSNSTYINSSSTEDERESYCSNILKFEIPADILDVNYEFM